MIINDQIEKTKEAIRQGRFTSEAAVSQGILLPFLHALGWPVFDTSIVVPEYSLKEEGLIMHYVIRLTALLPLLKSRKLVFQKVRIDSFLNMHFM